MSDAEVADYSEFGDAFFGRKSIGPRGPKDLLELFEWFMATSRKTPREKIISWFSPDRNRAELEKLGDEELLIEYCEAMTLSVDKLSKQKPAA